MALTPPRTVFLDQNKWIDLTHAFDRPKDNPSLFQLGLRLKDAVIAGKLLFPLTVNIIIETYKMSNDENRGKIAEIQAKFSQGYVFRDRNQRLLQELEWFIRTTEGLPEKTRPPFWWLSKNFVEAFVDWSTAATEFGIQPDQLQGIMTNPKYALYHWIAKAPKIERDVAMEHYSIGSTDIIRRISARLERMDGEKFAMRKRIYSAVLASDEIERMIKAANLVGLGWKSVTDIGDKKIKLIMQDVRTYRTEIELVSRIEALDRPVVENDLRDMQGFVSSIPFVDALIGEKLFVNLALQAKLDKLYGCQISTDIWALDELI